MARKIEGRCSRFLEPWGRFLYGEEGGARVGNGGGEGGQGVGRGWVREAGKGGGGGGVGAADARLGVYIGRAVVGGLELWRLRMGMGMESGVWEVRGRGREVRSHLMGQRSRG